MLQPCPPSPFGWRETRALQHHKSRVGMALVPPAMEAAEALAATAHAAGGGSEGTLGVPGNGGPGGSAAGILLSAPGGSSSPLAPSLDLATAVRTFGMDESMFRCFVHKIGGVWEEVKFLAGILRVR